MDIEEYKGYDISNDYNKFINLLSAYENTMKEIVGKYPEIINEKKPIFEDASKFAEQLKYYLESYTENQKEIENIQKKIIEEQIKDDEIKRILGRAQSEYNQLLNSEVRKEFKNIFGQEYDDDFDFESIFKSRFEGEINRNMQLKEKIVEYNNMIKKLEDENQTLKKNTKNASSHKIEVESLNRNLKEAVEENEKLINKKNKLKTELDEIKENSKMTDSEVDQYLEDISKKISDIDLKKNKIKELKVKRSFLISDNEKNVTKINELENDIKNADTDLKKKIEKIGSLKLELEAITNKTNSQIQEIELSNNIKAVKEAAKIFKEEKNYNEKLEKELKKLNYGDIEDQIKDKKYKIHLIKSSIKSYEGEKSELLSELKKLEIDESELRRELESLKILKKQLFIHEKEMDKNEIKNAKNGLGDKYSEITKYADLVLKHLEIFEFVETSKERYNKLLSTVSENEESYKHNMDLLEKNKKILEEKEDKNNTILKDIEYTKNKIDSMMTEIRKSVDLREDYAKISEEVTRINKEVRSDIEYHIKELREKEQKNSELSNQLMQNEINLKLLKNENEEQKKLYLAMMSEKAVLDEKNKKMEKIRQKQDEKITKIESEIIEKEKELEKSNKEIAEKTSEIDDLNKSIKAHEKEIDRLKIEVDKSKGENQKMAELKENYENELDELNKKLDKVDNELKDAMDKNKSISNELNEKASIAKTQAELIDLKIQLIKDNEVEIIRNKEINKELNKKLELASSTFRNKLAEIEKNLIEIKSENSRLILEKNELVEKGQEKKIVEVAHKKRRQGNIINIIENDQRKIRVLNAYSNTIKHIKFEEFKFNEAWENGIFDLDKHTDYEITF